MTTFYSFGTGANDGSYPNGLIQGIDGNLYGITSGGGTENEGTIFRIALDGGLATLYSFGGGGFYGPNGLIRAADGNFFGTTDYGGGPDINGAVFKFMLSGPISTNPATVLYAFAGPDGSIPAPGLIQGADGNFYGTTKYGGTGKCQSPQATNNGCGTIFKLTPAGSLTTLHSFNVTDGANPATGLIQGADGNFYGVTEYGGTGKCQSPQAPNSGCGTIFKITPAGTLTTLYTFASALNASALIRAADGNFYGTTQYGGSPRCGGGGGIGCGTIFKITPGGVLSTLYNFGTGATDGVWPTAALIQAADGNFYGTTSGGGGRSVGTVFRFTPGSPGVPAIALSNGVVNGATFQDGFSSGSWITIQGTNLSSVTDTWANAIVNGNLPTSLDGVSVTVEGKPAYVAYVSPTQINALAPDGLAGTLPVAVTNSNGTSPMVTATSQTPRPSFFQWSNYAVATKLDYSFAVKNGTFSGTTTAPAKPGDIIILWGTGFGPTNPSAPTGVLVPSDTTYNTAGPVTVTVGGVPVTVYGAALAPGFAGLYQVAIQIPTSLADGDYPVVAVESGVQSASTTLITVQK